MPEELVEKVELPDYAGLYIYKKIRRRDIDDFYIKKIKQGKLLHKSKVKDSMYRTCFNKYQHRMWSARNKINEAQSTEDEIRNG